ncbi:MAG: DUF3300 domain-containing protein [Opitutaceae bacterium]
MKTLIGLVLALLLAVPLQGQGGATEAEEVAIVELTEDYLDKLLGPLALHPDALVALILPASTVPTDIVLAARFLRSGGTVTAESKLGWDDSVQALARYPEIVYWLDEELSWTVDVGEAFMADPAAVMNAVQRLRARASAAGTLSTTHQQRVIVRDNIISIVPASTRVIYVPRYDPVVVYTPRHDHRPVTHLDFGFGHPTGAWLRYDCDWWSRRIWCFDDPHRNRPDWDRHWRHYRDHKSEIPGAHPWRPPHRGHDHDWREPRRPAVVHVERPRFDADPPSRREILEDRRDTQREVQPPRAIRRLDPGRIERDLRSRENTRRIVERREPRQDADVRSRLPVARVVERDRPRLAPAPRIERPAPNPVPRRSVVINTARPPTAPRVSAPARAPAPRIEPAPPPGAPTVPTHSDRGRSSREKSER